MASSNTAALSMHTGEYTLTPRSWLEPTSNSLPLVCLRGPRVLNAASTSFLEPWMLVVSDEHESHAAFGPRVEWLMGIVCGSRVLGTDMRFELLIALLSELCLHLVNGFAGERPGRVEHPSTFAASPSLKILAFHPDQFAAH